MNASTSLGLLWLFLLMLTACGSADRGGEVGASAPASIDDLSYCLSTFHRNPSQESMDGILAGFALHDEQLADASSLMASFLLLATKTYNLTVAHEPKSRALHAYQKADQAAFERWLADESTDPMKNDVLWMAFFVTGKDDPLDRILAIAESNQTQTESGQPLVLDLAGSTAAWSYRSNATQWPEVLDHARRRSATSSIAKLAVADAELTRVEAQREPVVP